jgi:pSer/pThr/pTyr-binding forkhead associated (FHA) protein
MLLSTLLIALVLVTGLVAWLLLRRRPMCKLSLRAGNGTGVEFAIRGGEATIGSREGQTVVVSHPAVSSLHATLTLEDGMFVLRDRSRLGTQVNGQAVRETVLRSGDLIRLGDSVDLIFTRLT